MVLLFGLTIFFGQAFATEWKPVWSDEFNYEGLPDPNKWGYEEGFVRNKEQQYYTRARKENARVEKGMLIIEGRKERFINPKFNPEQTKDWKKRREYAEYTSASLITLNKASWKYGRVEVRAKLKGQGVWPAIWMLGTNIPQVGWPACGEIDIMEFVGHTPNTVYTTIHYKKEEQHKSSGRKITVDKPFEDFHIYAMEWYADRMDFYFDDNKYFTFEIKEADYKGENPFSKPHYLLINLALGGSWGGEIDDSVLPQVYAIDYVRVYEMVAEGSKAVGSPH